MDAQAKHPCRRAVPGTAKAPAAGFTLIEVVVSLALLGIVGLFAGMGLVSATRAYVFARESVHLTQKAQVALGRITYELRGIREIVYHSANRLDYRSAAGDPGTVYRIERDQAAGRIRFSIIQGTKKDAYTLLENLGSYGSGKRFLTYIHENGATWTLAHGLKTLATIKVQLVLGGNQVVGLPAQLEVASSINPRNTGVPNAPPPRKAPS